MKYTIWIIVVVMLWICTMLAQRGGNGQHDLSNDAVVMVSSKEDVAGIVLLTFLSADEDDGEGLAIAESYLQTQVGFDLASEQDFKDMAKVRAVVKKYAKEMKELNAEWERHIPNDKEREAHQFNVVQKIAKLQRESAAVFKGTKAYWKVKQIESAVIEKEN